MNTPATHATHITADDARAALPALRTELERIERARDDLQSQWEQQATEMFIHRLTPAEQDKIDYSELLAGIHKTLDASFWEAIDDAEQAISDADRIIDEAEWAEQDARDDAEMAALVLARKAA